MISSSINRFLGVLCHPFSSFDYVKNDLIDDYIKEFNKNKKSEIKSDIRANLIESIRQKYNLYSYDEIYLYLDKCYLFEIDFEKQYSNSFECYRKKFSDLARSLISQRNGKLVFKYWENENDKNLLGGFSGDNKILLYHSLNRCISMDVLAIIYLIDNNIESTMQLHNFYGHILVSDLQLDYILAKGIAENHLHSGVSRSFLSIWESILSPLTNNRRKELYDFNKYHIKDNETMFYMLSCGIVRAFIAVVIKNNMNIDKIVFEDIKNEESLWCKIIQGFLKNNIEKTYSELSKDKIKDDTEDNIYDYFLASWNDFLDKSQIYDWENNNIIYTIFDESINLKTSGENLFLFKTFLYLKRHSGDENGYSSYIEKMLIQYIRIKNHIFNLLIQQKIVKGLDYFKLQYYSKNSLFNRVNNKDFWENALREQFQNSNLHKIEFRLSINPTENKFRKDVLEFLKSYRKILREDYCIKEKDYFNHENGNKDNQYRPIKKFPQVALVYHLLKRDDDTSPEKCFRNSECDNDNLYFKTNQDKYEELVTIMNDFRKSNSELSRYIVGLDAASLENSTPVWVFANIYEKARNSGDEPLYINDGLNSSFQSLGFTFHAGEDFRHILSGIRRIDEAVQHLKFHAGDRIGHGIAIGISPDEWRRENRCIIIPRVEALENYIWAYNILSQNYEDFNTSIIAYLEKKIYELSKAIYLSTEGLTVSVLIDGYLKLFSKKNENVCKKENWENFCSRVINDEPIIWNANKLYLARHCKSFLIRMNEPIHFEVTEQDIEISKYLQKIVKYNISKAGIVIEINPTSNISISNIDNLTENHIYSINNFVYDATNIIACINTDDPSIFNTNVSNELAYVYYGLLEKRVSKEDALKWIDKLRENGISSSFIKRDDTDDKILYKLNKLIESI